MIVKIRIPLYIQTGKKSTCKKYWLNLNKYRNWCGVQNNAIKQAFCVKHKKQITEALKTKIDKCLYVHYMIIRGNRRSFDTGNYISVVDKFFMDSLQKYNIIDDDSYKEVIWGSYSVHPEVFKELKDHHIDIILSDKPLFTPNEEILNLY